MRMDALESAARQLGQHPQDHGWREFFRLIEHGVANSSTVLSETLRRCSEKNAAHSPSHLINLLGIALKSVDPDSFARMQESTSMETRLDLLERALKAHESETIKIVTSRRNSFTVARRFLVPQVILSAVFAQHQINDVGFADLGTGLGVLPRQLNHEGLYRQFSRDLPWPGGIPRYRTIPIRRIIGVDCGPMPDLAWVRSCYGSSDYYADLFNELVSTLQAIESDRNSAEFREIDLLDAKSLTAFLRDQPIHAANLCYVLYEIEPKQRDRIIRTLLDGLHTPGLVIITEPRRELTRRGCDVLVYCRDRSSPYQLCTVSDGHFKGEVTALPDYEEFLDRYPITFDKRG